MTSQPKPLTAQEWEALIDDYNRGGARLLRWTSAGYVAVPLLELALSIILRRDTTLSLKLHLLVFLEEHSGTFHFATNPATLSSLLETLKSVILSPNDAVSVTYALKEQFLVSATSIFITSISDARNGDGKINVSHLEGLVELLLNIVNRPNHSVDRQTRGVACECLRELEVNFPCLLSEIGSHLWVLCQSERTHACQGYVLLLATVVHNIVVLKVNISIVNSSVQLVPFNVPRFLIDDDGNVNVDFVGKEISDSGFKELRRVIAFLLDCHQCLTPFGLLEFLDKTLPVAAALELQASLLRVQFSGMIYTFDPLLFHAYIRMCRRFSDSFEGQEVEIARRLVLMSKESQHVLIFRLLGLHWLLGFIGLMLKRDMEKKKNVLALSLRFYPDVFDPLALKTLKLDLLAYCSILLEGVKGEEIGQEFSAVKLFEDGLVSVSSFKWLPHWSSETIVAFRTFHKFLISGSSHLETSTSNQVLIESTIFPALKRMLVNSVSEFKGLVPITVSFINRLSSCQGHSPLGQELLETFDEHLLPKLNVDYGLGSYFAILERIAENSEVSPGRLLELLTNFIIFLVEKHGPDTGLKSWSKASKVLGICRTMLINHHSSRLFLGLSHLLKLACLYFPDLEIRDNARIFLRMLLCIPGKKLRHILSSGEQLPGVSPSTHSSSFYGLQSPRPSHDPSKSRNTSSYIHLERVVPLLVKQSWSLSLSTLGIDSKTPGYLEAIQDNEPASEQTEFNSSNGITSIEETKGIDQPDEPLRVTDSKVSKIVEILRYHFSSIPDFRHMPGFKIRISCSLRFEAGMFNHVWGINLPANGSDEIDTLPGLYATVLSFSSSAPYGSIPSYHIPFLLAEPPQKDPSSSQTNLLAIVPSDNGSTSSSGESFKASVVVELEPREPAPGLVDVFIEANTDNGKIVRGQLQSVTVGIEDMFLKPIVPEGIPEDAVASYYLDLFHALWEACGTTSNTGSETFVLKGGKGVAAISGTRSVKLLEVPMTALIQAVEQFLAPFVVGVTGETLVDIVRNGGIIRDAALKDVNSELPLDVVPSQSSLDEGPLYLKYTEEEDDKSSNTHVSRRNMGCFLILIFLPPRFHLLFQMEVSDDSTLVRIRTDHWPCLAYVDDYLEALFLQ